ncbi:hypothetical protein [Arthrobacter sp. UM1]|uniref:hypothetical protein n=1 Tax=Arthrobacter sp. UM1 TaxID=2766776 RepID=UPI001CF65D43|nr:hypothetical protein [Arthrobacter sp. UM1]MCB4208617.1 hypothetical protein [Arthrobacter sp. UM1]
MQLHHTDTAPQPAPVTRDGARPSTNHSAAVHCGFAEPSRATSKPGRGEFVMAGSLTSPASTIR